MTITVSKSSNRFRKMLDGLAWNIRYIFARRRIELVLIVSFLPLWQLVMTPLSFCGSMSRVITDFSWWALYDPAVNTVNYARTIFEYQILGFLLAALPGFIAIIVILIYWKAEE